MNQFDEITNCLVNEVVLTILQSQETCTFSCLSSRRRESVGETPLPGPRSDLPSINFPVTGPIRNRLPDLISEYRRRMTERASFGDVVNAGHVYMECVQENTLCMLPETSDNTTSTTAGSTDTTSGGTTWFLVGRKLSLTIVAAALVLS